MINISKRTRWLLSLCLLILTFPRKLVAAEYTVNPIMLPKWYAEPAVSAGPIIDPALLEAMAEPHPNNIPIIIILNKPSGDRPLSSITAAIPNRTEARIALVKTLKTEFELARLPLDQVLLEAESAGEASDLRELWIINGLALKASRDTIQRLAASSAVAELRLDHYRQYIDSNGEEAETRALSTETNWGVPQIRAPEVWNTLQVSGTGAVVAVMDTGVDLLHPALLENYRGNLSPGLFDHSASWYDAVNRGTYPYDDDSHGSHVAGIALGQGSLGVAPGASWIGVKVLDNDGSGYDSWVHAGFQWLLAPNGDPSLAPDVVNSSWGTASASATTFEQDIEALIAAEIFPVFAAGNEGPYPRSLRAPASLPGIFAVGASDSDDDTAGFSSRGPSPWNEIKPYVVAPGVNIRSSTPGGVLQRFSGTSMAAPHVSGLAALMRSFSTTLSVHDMAKYITQTAVPLSTTLPNNDSGWGRIDAYDALVDLMKPGLLSGSVTGVGEDGIPWAIVQAQPHGDVGGTGQAKTNANGDYSMALVPTTYDVTASAFGYAPRTYWNVETHTATQHVLNFALNALSTGTIQGQVTISGTAKPPTHTVVLSVLGTPISTTVSDQGYYQLSLPAGVYTLEARGMGYRIERAAVTVVAEQETNQNFQLSPAPKLLLIDEGAWYYASEIDYWREALNALDYTYDQIRIKFSTDVPTLDKLREYDIVLWSSPKKSPGVVNAADALNSYLEQGGRLFISGQNVAYYDGGGAPDHNIQSYLKNKIGAGYSGGNLSGQSLSGTGPFESLMVHITGPGGANNQLTPDQVYVKIPGQSTLLWQYGDNQAGGGIGASICVAYRAVFFSFGYEAIDDAAMREEVMARTLDWLTQPYPTKGLSLHTEQDALIGTPGTIVTHTVYLQHTGYAGAHDIVTVNVQGNTWQTVVSTDVIDIAPCDTVSLSVKVTIPETAQTNTDDTVTLNLDSSLLTENITVALTTKTPAPVLLIDDDRWYPMEDYYITALDRKTIPYDIWDLTHNESNLVGVYSTNAILDLYPIVVWFTGYDWDEPITTEESKALFNYLNNGGRLLLSSQDFLYKHPDDPMVTRLGILDWTESLNTKITGISSIPNHPAGGIWGPVTLDFPFKNNADIIEPAPDTELIIRGQQGQPVAIATETGASGKTRTLFYSFPIETIPITTRATVLEGGIGWLSPLGKSTWQTQPTTPRPGKRITHTLVLYNDAETSFETDITHTIPPSLTLAVETLPSEMVYHSDNQTLSWDGVLASKIPLTFTWATTVSSQAPAGHFISPTIKFTLPAWYLSFERVNALWVNSADLSTSKWVTSSGTLQFNGTSLAAGEVQTLGFALRNTGTTPFIDGRADLWLMRGLSPPTVTTVPEEGFPLAWWEGDLAPGETHWLTVSLRAWRWDTPLRVDALLQGVGGQRWERQQWLTIIPKRTYLPITIKTH